MLMDKKKIVSFYSELPSFIYMHSPKNYCFVDQHGCMLCRVIEKNSNMLRLGIFGVTKLLFRLYINVHPKSDIIYEQTYLKLDETAITDKYAISCHLNCPTSL